MLSNDLGSGWGGEDLACSMGVSAGKFEAGGIDFRPVAEVELKGDDMAGVDATVSSTNFGL